MLSGKISPKLRAPPFMDKQKATNKNKLKSEQKHSTETKQRF